MGKKASLRAYRTGKSVKTTPIRRNHHDDSRPKRTMSHAAERKIIQRNIRNGEW